jgi:hypothetical protein
MTDFFPWIGKRHARPLKREILRGLQQTELWAGCKNNWCGYIRTYIYFFSKKILVLMVSEMNHTPNCGKEKIRIIPFGLIR